MTKKQKDIIVHRLKRASETLAAAKILEDSHFYFGAVNRVYYACFYAVTALLATRGLASSKHSGVLSLFNRHFVKTGLVSKKWGEFYTDLFDTRHEGDYTDFADFTSEDVHDFFQSAATFVDEITSLVEKEIQ